MSFDFVNEYEKFARSLNCDGCSETNIRNSISRGYYSFYHRVRRRIGLTDKRYYSHDELIQEVENNTELEEPKRLANALRNMKTLRAYADYYRNPPYPTVFNKVICDRFWITYDENLKML